MTTINQLRELWEEESAKLMTIPAGTLEYAMQEGRVSMAFAFYQQVRERNRLRTAERRKEARKRKRKL